MVYRRLLVDAVTWKRKRTNGVYIRASYLAPHVVACNAGKARAAGLCTALEWTVLETREERRRE